MDSSLSTMWSAVSHFGLSRPTVAEWALLVLLGASLLALRTFHARYFKIWVLGWATLVVSRLTSDVFAPRIPAEYVPVLVQTLFVLAVGLLAGALLTYSRVRELIVPLAVITPVLVGFAGARILLWPDAVPLRMALEVAYRVVLLAAAVSLLRGRGGRWQIAPWTLALSLLLLHLPWAPVAIHISDGVFLAAEIVLGLSMLAIVFDEAALRTRRLHVVQALTSASASAQQYGNLVQTALEEMQRLTQANAMWFRLVEGGHLVATHALGVSADFLRDAGFSEITEELSKKMDTGQPWVANTQADGPENPVCLAAEQIRQVVILPVVGKKAPVGLLALGSSRNRQWTPEELEFLQSCARQVATAIENFRLLEQLLRSQRQWMNTFDSVHDIILAHDADFRVIKANQVLLSHLGLAAADVMGNNCESVLPHNVGAWTGCPYCAIAGDEDFMEGADLCFGGFAVVSTSSYTEQGSPQKGTIHVVRDITDRRSAEEKYRLLFEQVQEGVYVATPDGQLLDCNDALVHMLGYPTREDLMAVNLDSDICVDAAQREAFRKEIETHNYVRNFEVTLRRKDGTLLLASESSFATRDGTGNIERYQGFVLDVTEKRRAEDDMRRRNRELNALNAMAVVATQSFDLDEILNLTLRQVVSLFGAESGSVYLSDTDAPTYRRRASWGPRSRDKARPAEISFPDGFGDLLMRSRTEVVTAEYLPHLPSNVAEFIGSDPERSWIWVLFWGKDSPIGIMGLCSHQGHEYSSNEENLMVAISRQLATTIEKVRL
ncbi:MAG TPA: GAF domain-containing protein, partial [Candidatus Sulfotelmatobacter sp.]